MHDARGRADEKTIRRIDEIELEHKPFELTIDRQLAVGLTDRLTNEATWIGPLRVPFDQPDAAVPGRDVIQAGSSARQVCPGLQGHPRHGTPRKGHVRL